MDTDRTAIAPIDIIDGKWIILTVNTQWKPDHIISKGPLLKRLTVVQMEKKILAGQTTKDIEKHTWHHRTHAQDE